MPPDVLRLSVSLVGPGRAGKAFARSWLSAGGRLDEVIGRDSGRAQRAAEEIGAGSPRSLEGALACDVLLFAVPDDAIRPVATLLEERKLCRYAFHFSGALPAEALGPLRRGDASLGSLHPVRAFRGSREENWGGAFVGIEGDPAAARLGATLVEALGARPHPIASSEKPLYHCAATLAAGGTVALLSLATKAWVSIGVPEEQARAALADLSAGAAAGVAENRFADALTGPIARRDLATVEAHRAALRGRATLWSLYRLLAQEVLDQTPGRGKEEEIRKLLGPEP